jgi:BASS family bile acid:Na+ symporter
MNPEAAVRFSPESLTVLNVTLALLMFAVSLFIEPRDFAVLRERPRGLLAGLTMQWLGLPLLSVALIFLIRPEAGLALGMLLVAACPGGNVSNYLNLLARANVALSIGLTTISTLAAAFMTPLLFFIGAKLAGGSIAIPALQVDFIDMLGSVLLIVAAPLALGQLLRRFAPRFADSIRTTARRAAGAVLIVFIVAAFAGNARVFLGAVPTVLWIIVLHNALALGSGYLVATAYRLAEPDRRAVTIESGIHNSGLGLVLIFNFFGGSTPMALVAAGWGVWHLVSGGALALWWSKKALSAEG